MLLAALVGAVAFMFGAVQEAVWAPGADFAQLWVGARGLLRGENPYGLVGPGRAFPWPFPLLYPGTTLVVAIPFSMLPLQWATSLFLAVGMSGLAWVLTRERVGAPQWWMLASSCSVSALVSAQWSPLLVTGALVPWLSFLLACKPTIGLALLAAYPTRFAVMLSTGLLMVSLGVMPSWPADWLAALPAAHHVSAPITHATAGGPLILLALARWRLPEARLLLALSCVPQTTMPYESLPLFLVTRRWQESVGLVALSWLMMAAPLSTDYVTRMHAMGWRMTLLLYLPCLVMVMMRDNRWPGASTASPIVRGSVGAIGTTTCDGLADTSGGRA